VLSSTYHPLSPRSGDTLIVDLSWRLLTLNATDPSDHLSSEGGIYS